MDKEKGNMFDEEITEIRDKLVKLERDELLNNEHLKVIHSELTSLWYQIPNLS